MNVTNDCQLLSHSRIWITGLCMALLGLAPMALPAQTPLPPVVSYQGFLTTPAGAPLSGTFSLTFRLYNTNAAGSALWQETHPAVRIGNGVFSVLLGSIAPLLDDADIREFDRPFFLGVAINGAAELTPRLALASLPVAVQAKSTSSTVAVDCDAGESIAEAIERAPVGGRVTVTITGDCEENLVIERDYVSLVGNDAAKLTGVIPNSHPGNAVIYLDGVRSIEIDGLTIAGPTNGNASGMHGLMLDHVSSATLGFFRSTVIENHDGNGILVQARSQLGLFNSFVRGNRLNGIHARHGSNTDVNNTEISNNLRTGVYLHRRSSGRFTSSTVVDNGDGIEELGFCKCALYVDEGSQARIRQDNTFRSNSAHVHIGATIAVYHGSSVRFADGGTSVENTVFDPANRDAFVRAANLGVALVVEADSVVRVTGGTVTIRGWVVSNNLSTVDLREVVIEGHVGVYGLGATYRMRDQSGALDRISLTGDLMMFGGLLSLSVPPSTQAARIDGDIDCRGRSGDGVPSRALFQDPEDGYIDCANASISTDLAASIVDSADPISVNGSVSYDVTIDNIKRSPAVEARGVGLAVTIRSAASFTVSGADTSASPSAGSCNIDDPGSFDGNDFVGSVSCSFDSIRLSSGIAAITISSVQANLSVEAFTSVTNGDENNGNDGALETTTVQ